MRVGYCDRTIKGRRSARGDVVEPGASTRGLPSLLTALRHHVLALLAVTATVFGLGFAYVASSTPMYTASAVLLLSPAPGNPLTVEETSSSARLTVAMETEAGIVTTPAIADLASEALGRAVPGDEERIQVNVPGGTQMLRISFTSTSGERARAGAQTFADTYLTYRETRASTDQANRVERLESQAASADEKLKEALSGGAGEGTFSEREVEIYTERVAQLQADIGRVQVENVDPGRVITPATAPVQPVGLNPVLILIAASLGGLALGVLLSLFLEWRRDLVREDDQFDVSGVPVFAQLPRRATLDLVERSGTGVDAATHEAYRRLRAGVVANGPRPHVLAISAVGEHEHATSVGANLAVVLAEARFSVLLIAADPRDREIEALFGISESPGLSDVVQNGIEPSGCLQNLHGVQVLPGGSDPLGARELYAGQAMRGIVDGFRPKFDYVLIVASGTGTADGDAAIGAADSVLLAVTSSRTTHAEVSAALDRFARLRIETLGAVNVPPTATRRVSRRSAHAPHRDTQSRRAASEDVRAGA